MLAVTRWLPLLTMMLGLSVLNTCQPVTTHLQQVQKEKVLRVASVYGRTTCYAGARGLEGYECELVYRFAKRIGVTAEVTFCASPEAALQAVLENRADLAAAALTEGAARGKALFSRAIDRDGAQLVYRMGTPRPKNLGDVTEGLVIAAGTDYEARLLQEQSGYPSLRWTVTDQSDTEDLLLKVAEGEVPYTVASTMQLALQQRYYPQLRPAFDLGLQQDVALAFAPHRDRSLYDAANTYLQSLSTADMRQLHDRYYGHVNEADYYSVAQLASHMEARLPRYRRMFERIAARHQLDWRLLAAIGYQESQWNPSAVSRTGVRGMMMLTQATAQRYGVQNREDPAQSVEGAGKVLADLYAAIPASVQEPDRSWMVLAAYNQGLGHLLDARRLAERQGGNPDLWLDVRDAYPLLSRPRWLRFTRYGAARGIEAVDFVNNVRSHYDLIAWITSGAAKIPPPQLRMSTKLRSVDPQPTQTQSAPVAVPEAIPTVDAEPSDADEGVAQP